MYIIDIKIALIFLLKSNIKPGTGPTMISSIIVVGNWYYRFDRNGHIGMFEQGRSNRHIPTGVSKSTCKVYWAIIGQANILSICVKLIFGKNI